MSGYRVLFSKSAKKQFDDLDRSVQLRISAYINRYLVGTASPRQTGKALQGKYTGLWRYRIGNYRLVCQIKDGELVILTLKVGHRSKIYSGAGEGGLS
jgi:mRNA interferase RelE/StbE